jgi:phage-related minor tail protein
VASVAELMLLFKGDTSDVAGKTDEIAGKMKSLAKSAAGAMAGFATGKGVEELANLGMAFDDVYDGMAIKTGATGAELEALQQSFRDVVSTVPADFETAGAAVGALSQRLDLTGQPLTDMATQMANLSRITGTDVTANVNAAADVLTKLGVSADEQAGAVDQLFAASQASGLSFQEMAQKIGDAAPQLDMLGMSAGQGANLFGLLEKAGLNSGVMMKGVTKFAAENNKVFADNEKAVEKMVKAKDKEFEAEGRLQEAMKKYGPESEQVAKARAKLTTAHGEYLVASKALEESDAALASAQGPLMDALGGTLQQIKNMGPGAEQTKAAMEAFGLKAGPELLLALNSGKLGVEDFSTVLANTSPGINETAASTDDMQQKFDLLKNKVMLAAEGFAPLGMTIAPFASMAPMLGGAMGALAPALAGVGTAALGAVPGILAFLAPFAPIILAVGAVIAIGVLLYKHWDDIKAAAQALGDMLAAKFDEIKTWISERVEAIRAWVQEKWDAMCSGVTASLEGLRTSISQGWDRIKEYLSTRLEEIRAYIEAKWEAAKTAVGEKLEAIRKVVSEKWEEAKRIVEKALDLIKEIIERYINAWKAVIETAFKIADWLWGIISGAASRVSQALGDLASGAIATAIGLWKGIVTGALKLADWIGDAISGIADAGGTLWTKFSDVGKAVIAGLRQGIADTFSDFVSWFSGLFPNIIDLAKQILGIGSPSRVFREIGEDIGAGLVAGIKSSAASVVGATQYLIASVVRAGQQAVPELMIGAAGGELAGMTRSIESLMEHIMSSGWGSGGVGGNALAAWMRMVGYDEETVRSYKDLHQMREGGHWKTREAFALWRRRVMPRGGDWTGASHDAMGGLNPNVRPIGPYGGYDDLYVPRPNMGTAFDPNAITRVEIVKGTEIKGTMETYTPIMISFKINEREISAITEQVVRRLGGTFIVSPSPGTP